MGGNMCPLNNSKIKESWDFEGEITYQNFDITYGNLKGNLSILEGD